MHKDLEDQSHIKANKEMFMLVIDFQCLGTFCLSPAIWGQLLYISPSFSYSAPLPNFMLYLKYCFCLETLFQWLVGIQFVSTNTFGLILVDIQCAINGEVEKQTLKNVTLH